MIIDVTGFGWSGSGAVLDLLCEYKETYDTGGFEFSILHNVDGIMDLEYKLMQKHCRIFDSDIAIKRFLHLVQERYDKRGPLKNIAYPWCKDYVERITGIEFLSHSYYDTVYIYGIKDFIYKIYNKLILTLFSNSVSKKIVNTEFVKSLKIYNVNTKYLSYKPENFYTETQTLMHKLVDFMNVDKSKFFLTDHMLSPDNPSLFFKFLNDEVKCIIVRRDPRDTYILAKEIYKGKIPVPVETIDKFIWFYKKTIEETIVEDSDRILNVKFEDLVYNYDKTKSKIEDFCGLKEHVSPMKKFNPNSSIHNTMLYKKYTDYHDDIAKIEYQLKKSLYNFELYNIKPDLNKKSF